MRPAFLFVAGSMAARRLDEIEARVSRRLPTRQNNRLGTLFSAANCRKIDMPSVDGWVIGTLYRHDGRHRRLALAPAEQLAVMSTHGRNLIERYSGDYVAMWRGPGPGIPNVLRGPTGCQPALYHNEAGLLLIASDPEDLIATGLVKPDICTGGLAHNLRFPHAPTVRTCLSGIREVVPGERLEFGPSPQAVQLWTPQIFVERKERKTGSLALAIDAVVEGMAGDSPVAGLELSGGLDSSIVADALRRARPDLPIVGIHFVPDAADGDERRYANIVADRYALPLHEIAIDARDMGPLARGNRLTARPTGFGYMQPLDRKLRAAHAGVGDVPIFTGAGGDSVFCALRSTAPIIDAWRDGGLRLANRVLTEIATITETTRYDVLRHLCRRVLRRSRADWRWPADDRLLDRNLRAEPERHPWLAARLPAGSRAHIATVLRIQTIVDAHDRLVETDMLFPLLAQPVLEACFAIPSWSWMAEGRDRSAVRQAYRGRVPDAILDRRGKGRLDSPTVEAFERSRAGLRELLCGGYLADQRMVDQQAITQALARPVTLTSTLYPRILALADAELWCRSILGRQRITGPG